MVEDTGRSAPPASGAEGGPDADGPAADAPAARGAPAAATTTITLKLYATLQELLPGGAVRNAVSVDVAADASLNDVIDRYRVPRPLAHLVLVNGVFVGAAERDARGALRAGDVLAIWPPVAGG